MVFACIILAEYYSVRSGKAGINRYLYISIFGVLFICSAFFHSAWLDVFRVCRFGIFFAIGKGFANELVRIANLKRRILITLVTVFLLLEGFYIFQLHESGYILKTFDEEPINLFPWFVLATYGGYICIGICRVCTRNISEKNWISHIGKNLLFYI